MKAHNVECCHRERRSTRPSPRAGPRGALLGLALAGVAVLTPKCPMCIAAWLGVIGFSGLAAHVDSRALGFAAALMAALAAAGVAVAAGAAIVQRFAGRNTRNTKEGDRT
jgi:hypothetical protein